MRLTIDEVIEHCNRTCDMTEKLAKARGHELESIESKQFWEHYHVREWLKELKQYREIGTLEEFKALKEKNEPKKPRFYAHNYYCTECGNLVGNYEFEWQRFQYCDKCGQKIVCQ